MREANHLEIKDLSVAFADSRSDVICLDQINLNIKPGEIVGLVGESGCGKSTLCRSILRSLRSPAYIASGSVLWKGQDLFELNEVALNKVRWREIAMVVQSSLDALNPVMTVEKQLLDAMRVHMRWTRAQEMARCHELLDWVGLPKRVLKSYPFEMSGGMRQRVVIAMALALEPQLLIMDEPTTALDVVTQAEILGRIRDLQEKQGFSVILVTHDLPLALDFCDSIAVMYAGRIVEKADSAVLMQSPWHPYTEGLLNAFPKTEELHAVHRGVPGDPACLTSLPGGCSFHPRCRFADGICVKNGPELVQRGDHAIACHHPRSIEQVIPDDIKESTSVIPPRERVIHRATQGVRL